MGRALEVGKARKHLVDRHGALPEHDRLRAREIDHGRGRPGQRAPVDDRRHDFADRGGDVLDAFRILLPREVGARRDERAERREDVAAVARDDGNAGADRVWTALR